MDEQRNVLFCAKLLATGNPEYPPYLWQESKNSSNLIGAIAIVLINLVVNLGYLLI
ncbi:hypothetical protein [Spartinivicinus ruber]|uniref:hypothetical protein n=1 Tax=Spartinivicinus ruber TaxID=2683272 RepID=UPI0013D6B521|nr:hypothetical protein [Spartinivicinus ruber]